MKKILIICLLMFGIIGNASATYSKLAYDFEFNSIDGTSANISGRFVGTEA